jgi:hypothetical protein
MFKYTTLESFFNSVECEKIINNSLKNIKLIKAKVGKDTEGKYTGHRNSSIAFVDCNTLFPEIVKKLQQELIKQVKVKGYELDFKETKTELQKPTAPTHNITHTVCERQRFQFLWTARTT